MLRIREDLRKRLEREAKKRITRSMPRWLSDSSSRSWTMSRTKGKSPIIRMMMESDDITVDLMKKDCSRTVEATQLGGRRRRIQKDNEIG